MHFSGRKYPQAHNVFEGLKKYRKEKKFNRVVDIQKKCIFAASF
jgi:hypothetical protein